MVSTVAVVDDEPRILNLYATWLEQEYDVVRAAGGEAALDVVDDDVDVVLLDRRMPDLSGDEVLARLRDRGYDGWVVMVTAVDPDVDVASIAFDEYVVKPVDREGLLRAVEVVEARGTYDEELQSYFQVLAKLGVLEAAFDEAALAESDEYQQLRAEQREIKGRLDEAVAKLDERDAYDDLFIDLPTDAVEE